MKRQRQKHIGLWALIVFLILWLVKYVEYNGWKDKVGMDWDLVLGFLFLTLGLLIPFLAVQTFARWHNAERMGYWPAFGMGALISLLGATLFLAATPLFFDDFPDRWLILMFDSLILGVPGIIGSAIVALAFRR